MSLSIDPLSLDLSNSIKGVSGAAAFDLHQVESAALAFQGQYAFNPRLLPPVATVIGGLELLPLARCWKRDGIGNAPVLDLALVNAMRTGEKLKMRGDGVAQFCRASDPVRMRERIDSYLLEFRKSLALAGIETSPAMALAGAFSELHDNIWQHSGKPSSGFCGYEVLPNESISFGVAIPVRGSLRSSPYAYLTRFPANHLMS